MAMERGGGGLMEGLRGLDWWWGGLVLEHGGWRQVQWIGSIGSVVLQYGGRRQV